MSTRIKVIAVTAIVAIVAFPLGPILWPSADSGGGPGGLLPFFMLVGALEAVALGLGISFLLFGRPWVKSVAPDSKTVANVLYFAIAWSLVSWWPHDNMHISNASDNWGRLLMIEYMFHVTLIITAIGMAWAFFHVMQRCRTVSA